MTESTRYALGNLWVLSATLLCLGMFIGWHLRGGGPRLRP